MSQILKKESRVPIRASAERFYQTYNLKQRLMPTICPSIVKGVELIEGGWDSVGSVKKWTYALPGTSSSETCTLLTEAMDETTNSITTKVLDGNIKKLYSSFKITIQVNPEGTGSSVKTTVEYEKQNPDVPEPSQYLDGATAFYMAIDAYLIINP